MQKYKCDSVVKELVCKIRAGFFAKSTHLPGEAEMAAQFCASRETIRKAKGVLENAGVVRSSKGRGTYLTPLNSTLAGSIGVIVANDAWRDAFFAAMGSGLMDGFNAGCLICVADSAADTLRGRFAKAKAFATRFAAFGVRGMVWQVEEGDVSRPEWRKRYEEVLSMAAAAGVKTVAVLDDMSCFHGIPGFDAVGVDWFDWGGITGRQLAESRVSKIHFVASGGMRTESLLAGMQIESRNAEIVLHRSTDECLAHCLQSGGLTGGEAFVFCAAGDADRFAAKAESCDIEIPPGTVFLQYGKAGSPFPRDARIATMRLDCRAAAVSALKCMIARLGCPSCHRLSVHLSPEFCKPRAH